MQTFVNVAHDAPQSVLLETFACLQFATVFSSFAWVGCVNFFSLVKYLSIFSFVFSFTNMKVHEKGERKTYFAKLNTT